ncbi:GNAT family N-acetyltransferase [Streptomyces luteolus]|uniref:GNAT family N-acetyltransferase n=1 Tax=Streptomyces luteolus TaxID=3043615 RepID=A0ABT6T4V7_9ACTN|nr:GNAT family N-acetyltransferase [Streptomyces sp. B-S-A12]MDI3422898.1 GNAT family N-acetyltransferase [Streptomyces sp. B-S-A12]
MSLELRTHGPQDARELRTLLLDVHDGCYEGEEDPFHARERFAWFVDHWSANPGFVCVIGYDSGEPVGFAYGAPLAAGSPWWAKVEGLDDDFRTETGKRTFAVSEVMVLPKWRGQSISHTLHEALLDGRPEQRSTLLVDRDHPKVQALYESWGYAKVGETQPFNDAPVYAAMLRPLGGHTVPRQLA